MYRDRASGRYLMPWVRLHAQKDYMDMLAVLKGYPNLKQTFNLVPSLLEQIVDYAEHEALDRMLELLVTPVESFSPADREYLLERGFDVNGANMLAPYPRYAELAARRDQLKGRPLALAAEAFNDADWADLVTWFNLAWFDPLWLREDAVLARLVKKGRGFELAERKVLRDLIRDYMRRVVPAYREMAAGGQIELTTTPYYHPILPLLCDTDSARVARPELPLPAVRFSAPEDADRQLSRGLAYFEKLFGHKPRGLWPSEQSVSPEAVKLIARHGLAWTISDEGVLANSLGARFVRGLQGVPAEAATLYQPYRVDTPEGSLAMVFRDVVLSDLIGFTYARMPAPEAAADLHERLNRTRRLLPDGEPYLVTIALDGENCWENYVNDGADFLHAFYDRVSRDAGIELVTVADYLDRHPPRRTIQTLFSGSWIGADFTTWIGDPTKNLAWDMLARARADLMARREALVGTPAWQQALDELDVAEGSDWFWWYGEGHDSGQDALFDHQFRLHIRHVYELAGLEPPEATGLSLYPEEPPPSVATAALTPHVDGIVHPEEWAAATVYDPAHGQGAMHAATGAVESVRYGCGADELYLAVEFSPRYAPEPGDGLFLAIFYPGRASLTSPVPAGPREEGTATYRFAQAVQVDFERPSPARFLVAGEYDQWHTVANVPDVARGEALELALPLALLHLPAGQELRFAVALVRGEQLLEIHPRHEALSLVMPELRTLA